MSQKSDDPRGQPATLPLRKRNLKHEVPQDPGKRRQDSEKSGMIGDALKNFYQHTLDEKVPEDFQSLLDKLK